jgi:hypothetical protein
MQKLKFAFLLSSLVASATLFAQNNTPAQAQSAVAKAPASRPAQVAQAPAAGGQSAGVTTTATGTGTGAAFAIPAAIAAGLVAIIAAQDSSSATTHH